LHTHTLTRPPVGKRTHTRKPPHRDHADQVSDDAQDDHAARVGDRAAVSGADAESDAEDALADVGADAEDARADKSAGNGVDDADANAEDARADARSNLVR
jgi:hypothetical protein